MHRPSSSRPGVRVRPPGPPPATPSPPASGAWGRRLGFLLALALSATPGAGQDRSILSLLETEGRGLSVGEAPRNGALTARDLVTASGQRVQAWTLEIVAAPVRVDLSSDDFDSFLYVLRNGSGPVLEDDDGGGGLDARVCLDRPGSYTVVAASLGGDTGSFRLQVSAVPEGACPSLDEDWSTDEGVDVALALSQVVPRGPLAIPGTETFRFDGTEPRIEARPVRSWTFRGEAGERFAFTHRAPGVDTYLYLIGPGLGGVLRDDDGGGDLDARLCVELPSTGEYTVHAAPFSQEADGAVHRLEATRGDEADRVCEGSFPLSPEVVVERLLGLDAQGRTIGVGDTVRGSLNSEHLHPESGDPIQPWRLDARAGTRVFVDVVSESFDATVRAVWPGLGEELFNDDFGEGCNSRLEFVVPDEGPILLLPGSWSTEGRGEFVLRVSTDPGPLEAGGCVAGVAGQGGGPFAAADAAWEMVGRFASPDEHLEAGTEVSVELDESNSIVIQGVRARGWQVDIDETGDWIFEAVSDDVDPVLYLMGPTLDEPLFDDDSAGSLDARIEVRDAGVGRWVIVAGALGEAEGSVRLRVLRRLGGG